MVTTKIIFRVFYISQSGLISTPKSANCQQTFPVESDEKGLENEMKKKAK